MITLGGFFLGLFLMGIGFLMVWKTHAWKNNVGNLYMILGYPRLQWLDWNFLGVLLMFVGAVIGFGLLSAFLSLTLNIISSFLGG